MRTMTKTKNGNDENLISILENNNVLATVTLTDEEITSENIREIVCNKFNIQEVGYYNEDHENYLNTEWS